VIGFLLSYRPWVLVMTTDEYKDWNVKYRRFGAPLRYGQSIQLRHAGSGEFLAARLKYGRSSGGALYELGLDTAMPDPYCEGSSDSWLTIVPATPGRVLGELVRWADEVSFVSARWDWPCSVPGVQTATSTEHGPRESVSCWRAVQYSSGTVGGKSGVTMSGNGQSTDADVAVCVHACTFVVKGAPCCVIALLFVLRRSNRGCCRYEKRMKDGQSH
jgi:hypothetical protein